MTELELRQMFKNLSDCYADTGKFENDGSYFEGEVIQAMTEDRFIETLKEAKFITSNTVLCDSVLPDYEYEMFFNSEPNDTIQIHGWYPIATDIIRHPEKINHYIEKGILRRITKGKTVA